MAQQTILDRLTTELYSLLDETFRNVHGHYLDKHTSLFETLATISAEEASQPVGDRCATLAAQVNHIRVYIEVLERSKRGEEVGQTDWAAIWRSPASMTRSGSHSRSGSTSPTSPCARRCRT